LAERELGLGEPRLEANVLAALGLRLEARGGGLELLGVVRTDREHGPRVERTRLQRSRKPLVERAPRIGEPARVERLLDLDEHLYVVVEGRLGRVHAGLRDRGSHECRGYSREE